MPMLLVLEDGTVFRGRSCGAPGESCGEVVFNTAMSGYQEILTDPSYKGQMVVMTYPLIGNYGVNDEDMESRGTFLAGFVVREMSPIASNYRASMSLPEYLRQQGVQAIEGVDTRRLTRLVRSGGSMRAILSTVDLDPQSLLRKVRAHPLLDGLDLATGVSCEKPYAWTEGNLPGFRPPMPPRHEERLPIVALDFGIKRNILRNLVDSGFDVTVVPATTTAAEILARKPRGLFLSNGPGDPAAVEHAIRTVQALLGKLPIFGICLGHQILGHVFGGKTFKMKFGHHGGNQPVMELGPRKVEITSQNHSFAVDPASLPPDVEVSHLHLNDRTVSGLRHKKLPVFSVQYHPEAGPGPNDGIYLFARFREMIEGQPVA
ncbi:MAG: glutamine-hydrolyzing carbamoyl-phosphate synthase small subunit [Planctomycetes bacterium]|nr:glutamine-hydrolyzing carbamoyl-phosphate synthase small subunit [Planctomycetota bacterium]